MKSSEQINSERKWLIFKICMTLLIIPISITYPSFLFLTITVFPIALYYFIEHFRLLYTDSIKLNELGITWTSHKGQELIRYENIKEIKHRRLLKEIVIYDQENAVTLPKMMDNFNAIYERIEEEVVKNWRTQLMNDEKLVFKTNRFFYTLPSFCMLLFSGVAWYFFPLQEAIMCTICALLFFIHAITSWEMYTLTNENIIIEDTSKRKSYRLSHLKSIDYNNEFWGPVTINLSFEGIEKPIPIWGRCLNYPMRTVYRFIKAYYGIKETVSI